MLKSAEEKIQSQTMKSAERLPREYPNEGVGRDVYK